MMICITCKKSFDEIPHTRFCNECGRLLLDINELYAEKAEHLNNIEWATQRIEELNEIIYSLLKKKNS